ncbi:MAG: hypothetical protein AAGH79_14970, partial [Bacteroidota bacterium]
HVYLLGDTLVLRYANFSKEFFHLIFLVEGPQELRLLEFDFTNLGEPFDWVLRKGSLRVGTPIVVILEEGCRLRDLAQSYTGLYNSPGPFLLPAKLEAEILFELWSERLGHSKHGTLNIEFSSKTSLRIDTEC